MIVRFFAVLVTVVFGLVPAAGRAADPYAINVILPLTGPSTFLGQGGKKALEGLELAVNRSGGIRGRPVTFDLHDDQGNPQLTVQLMNAIMATHVPVVIGSATVATCRAIVPLVKDGPVLYCLTPGLHPDPGSYAFSANVSTLDTAGATIRYFVERGVKRIAAITSIDANGQDADDAINAGLRALGAEGLVVAREHFALNDLSVSAQMARIKAANPQLIIAWSSGAPLGTILHAAKDAGLDDIPVLTTNANANRPEMHEFASLLPQELYFPGQVSDTAPQQIANPGLRQVVDTFNRSLVAVGIAKPDESYQTGWDAAAIVVEGLRKLGTDTTSAALRDYIANLRGFTGIKGTYDFRAVPQRGLSQNAVVVIRWDASTDGWRVVSKAGGLPLR